MVLLTHWMLEFMKQVLPRLLRPVAPFSVGTGRGNKDINQHIQSVPVSAKDDLV